MIIITRQPSASRPCKSHAFSLKGNTKVIHRRQKFGNHQGPAALLPDVSPTATVVGPVTTLLDIHSIPKKISIASTLIIVLVIISVISGIISNISNMIIGYHCHQMDCARKN